MRIFCVNFLLLLGLVVVSQHADAFVQSGGVLQRRGRPSPWSRIKPRGQSHLPSCVGLRMGAQGSGSRRGGKLPKVELGEAEALVGDASLGKRLLVIGRDEDYREVWELEMNSVNATEIEPGLWTTAHPIPRDILECLTSVRLEMIPLAEPSPGLQSLETLRGFAPESWAIHHERLVRRDQQQPSSGKEVRAGVSEVLGGRADNHGAKVIVTVVEGQTGYTCGFATWTRGAQTKLNAEKWRRRPFAFSGSLDITLARAACNIANVRRETTVLDPCCGSGTVLWACMERGARARGLDIRPAFVMRCRNNLEYAGYGTLCGGWMRSEASAETVEAPCVVGQHDCRDSMECLSSLSKPDVVIANLPHGLNFKTSYDTIDYARDMLSSLAQGCRTRSGGGSCNATRIVLIAGGKLIEKPGLMEELAMDAGMQVLASARVLSGMQTVTVAELKRA